MTTPTLYLTAPSDSVATAAHPPGACPSVPWLQTLDPRAKIGLCLSILITVVSTPPQALPAFLGFAVLLAGLLTLAGASPAGLLRHLRRCLPVLLLMALPILCLPGEWPVPLAHRWLAWNLAIKATLSLATVHLLNTLLSLPELLHGLDRLRLPRLLLTLLQLTHRYTAVLIDETQRMQRARTARGGRSRWLWQSASLGHLIGALFVRSVERAERVHHAMLARGFDGISLTGPAGAQDQSRWRTTDSAALALAALLLLTLRLSVLA